MLTAFVPCLFAMRKEDERGERKLRGKKDGDDDDDEAFEEQGKTTERRERERERERERTNGRHSPRGSRS
jgi:hypothetical protein